MDTAPPALIPLNDLAKSIANGDAVLILGPDAIPLYRAHSGEAGQTANETTFSQLSRQAIQSTPDIGINFFYERDNLFLFRNKLSKQKARKVVQEMASSEQWLPDEELLRQIVAMPFHLVLSLSPDTIVRDAFIRHYQEPQFGFCSPYKMPDLGHIKKPDRNNPLIFNLCGNVLEKPESQVLDYFDLFQLFIKLLSNSEDIPTSLALKLKEADTYILLGFQLDRWYFQMFLHYLNSLDNNDWENINQNFAFLSHVGDDAREFVFSQFNIRQVAPNRADFDALYQVCREKGILRELHDPLSPVATQIRILVAQGKFEEAFATLEPHLDGEMKQIDLPHLKSRYQQWKQQQQDKTAYPRDLDVEINQIRYTLLTYANQLKSHD